MALVLIGFMGAGKSTLAGRLAALRGRAPIDSDALLVERFGHSVAREFELHGEQAFRAAEEEVVCGLLESVDARDVIALGGGSVLSARVRAALTEHTTALIEVAPALAWERVRRGDGAERPLARDRDAFRRCMRSGAGCTKRCPMRHLLWAESASGDYPVFVGSGLLNSDRLACLWPFDSAASRPFCVSDETVASLYAERLGELSALVSIPPGEQHKTLASAEHVWDRLVSAGMTRADHVVALGGGVVGDLAGFCAATYQRGVPVVQVPTTLVAQVDSAYGGKTGVDLPAAKNYVGAYHQPAGVLVDPDTLVTLPAAELAAGWVEVLKTALIAGGDLWERVAAGGEVDERTILACARTKLAVVAADERDARAPAGAEPRAHRRPRDRDRDRLRPLPPRRGGRSRAAHGAAPLRARGSARASARAAAHPRAARDARRRRRRGRADRRGHGARQEARRRARAVRARPARRARSKTGCEVADADLRARRGRVDLGSCSDDGRARSHRGAARGQPRSCSASRSTALRHADTGRSGGPDSRPGRRRWI